MLSGNTRGCQHEEWRSKMAGMYAPRARSQIRASRRRIRMTPSRGGEPGGRQSRWRGSQSWRARQQEAQANPTQWFVRAPYPDDCGSPGRERCEASRELANNNPNARATCFAFRCAELKTSKQRAETTKRKNSRFPQRPRKPYAACSRNSHAQRADQTGSGI